METIPPPPGCCVISQFEESLNRTLEMCDEMRRHLREECEHTAGEVSSETNCPLARFLTVYLGMDFDAGHYVRVTADYLQQCAVGGDIVDAIKTPQWMVDFLEIIGCYSTPFVSVDQVNDILNVIAQNEENAILKIKKGWA